MWTDVALIGTAAATASALTTGLIRTRALSHGMLDVPNERSSHTRSTPRGGGAAIVVAVCVGSIVLAMVEALRPALPVALLGGGAAVATVGYIDDRFTIAWGARLVVHLAAAAWALIWLGGMPAVLIGGQLVQLGWVGELLALLGIVWTLNLFNFMDGIDGIAASEGIFIGCAAGFLILPGGASGVAQISIVLAAACGGFLLWNWPPAKIFMGDVGSGYIGYVLAVLALAAAHDNPAALWVWLILGGVFLVDATVTLVRRLARGDPIQLAHRTHAYQWLARRWQSHRRVTLSVLALNLFWLLPWACLAAAFPRFGAAITLAALAPLTVLALAAGAGRAEVPLIQS
jgi:Fuc2NAc and GlcNAc transferase